MLPRVAAAVHPRRVSLELTRGMLESETMDGRQPKEQQIELERASATRGWSTVLLIDSRNRVAEEDRPGQRKSSDFDKAPTQSAQKIFPHVGMEISSPRRSLHSPENDPMNFIVTKFAAKRVGELHGPRLGILSLGGRVPIKTPHFIANTSRGIVPHLTQDVLRENTETMGIYVGLEDFIEKAPQATPPIMSYPSSYALKEFISAHKGLMTIVGPRRIPPVECPNHNTETSITICTSVGFRSLKVDDYIGYLLSIRPDVVIGLADNPPHPGVKRKEKMADRTCFWTTDMLEDLCVRPSPGLKPASILAPILPIDYHQQSMYLDTLVEKYEPYIGGMALYSPSSVSAVPNQFEDHPFFLFDSPANPHLLLAYIALGIDIFTIPFIDECSEQGIGLTFSFPAPPSEIPGAHPLGMDLRYIPYATEDKPLVPGCECNTCKTHHRAYIHHLLNAKEMLGWTLLQIHNTHVMEQFFARVRESILLETFDKDLETFGRRYETDLPKGTVGLPTKRGYQMKSERNSKRQPRSYNKLEDAVGGVTVVGEGDSDPTPPEPTMFNMSSPEDTRDDANAEVEIVDEMTLKSKMFRRMRVAAEETHVEMTGKDEVEDEKAPGDTDIGEEGETMKHLFASHP